MTEWFFTTVIRGVNAIKFLNILGPPGSDGNPGTDGAVKTLTCVFGASSGLRHECAAGQFPMGCSCHLNCNGKAWINNNGCNCDCTSSHSNDKPVSTGATCCSVA